MTTDDRAGAEDLLASHSDPNEGRSVRMARWIQRHPEFDLPKTKGQVIFNLGRRPGSGGLAVSATFHPAGEDL